MKWVLAALSLLTVWICGVAVWIATGPSEDPKGTADAAIVLGAAVDFDKPSPVFAARIDHAITLYHSGRVSKLVFTGARSPEDAKSEALAAKDYSQGAGVPASAILIEEISRTTHQNLIEATRVLPKHQLDSALIVSDPLHLQRALWMADGLGLDASTSATPSTRYQSWSTKGPFLMREVYFIHHHWIFGE